MNACKSLVRYALQHGVTVSVWDGEEWAVKRSLGFANIMAHINTVEMAELVFRFNGELCGWALVCHNSDAPDETVIDHTTTGLPAVWDWDVNNNQWDETRPKAIWEAANV